MYRQIPTVNKIISRKEKEAQQYLHQRRLRNISAHIDTSSPATYEAINYFNRKKFYMMEDRYTEIERENRILLEKITGIMYYNGKSYVSYKNPSIYNIIPKKSLNEKSRKRYLVQITIENQNILKRIYGKRSEYSVQHWEKDYRRHQLYRQNIYEFPEALANEYTFLPTTIASGSYYQARSTNPRSAKDPLTSLGEQANTSVLSNTESSQQAYGRAESQGASKLNQVRLDPFKDGRDGKLLLAKKSKKFGLAFYIIEVCIENGIFRISADDVENPLTKVLEMYEADGLKVLRRFFYNSADTLIDNLKITDKIYIKGLERFYQIDKNVLSKSNEHVQIVNSPEDDVSAATVTATAMATATNKYSGLYANKPMRYASNQNASRNQAIPKYSSLNYTTSANRGTNGKSSSVSVSKDHKINNAINSDYDDTDYRQQKKRQKTPYEKTNQGGGEGTISNNEDQADLEEQYENNSKSAIAADAREQSDISGTLLASSNQIYNSPVTNLTSNHNQEIVRLGSEDSNYTFQVTNQITAKVENTPNINSLSPTPKNSPSKKKIVQNDVDEEEYAAEDFEIEL